MGSEGLLRSPMHSGSRRSTIRQGQATQSPTRRQALRHDLPHTKAVRGIGQTREWPPLGGPSRSNLLSSLVSGPGREVQLGGERISQPPDGSQRGALDQQISCRRLGEGSEYAAPRVPTPRV